jgi:copper(I)-binding protein
MRSWLMGCCCCLAVGSLQAQNLRVESALAFPAQAGENMALALVVRNPGPELILGQARTTVAARVSFRVHQLVEGIAQITTTPTFILPAQRRVSLLPGAHEIFLQALNQPLVAGREFPLLLTFGTGQTQTIRVKVQPDLPVRP